MPSLSFGCIVSGDVARLVRRIVYVSLLKSPTMAWRRRGFGRKRSSTGRSRRERRTSGRRMTRECCG